MTRERESLLPKKPAKQRGATKLGVALVGAAALALAAVAVDSSKNVPPQTLKNYYTYGLESLNYEFKPEGRVGMDEAKTWGNWKSGEWSAIIPPAWFLQKNDDVHNAVMEEGADFHIMGGNVGKLHDQMTPLSEIYWISGAQHQFWPCGKQ